MLITYLTDNNLDLLKENIKINFICFLLFIDAARKSKITLFLLTGNRMKVYSLFCYTSTAGELTVVTQ